VALSSAVVGFSSLHRQVHLAVARKTSSIADPSTGWEFVSILLAPSRELTLNFCFFLVNVVAHVIFCHRCYLYCLCHEHIFGFWFEPYVM